MLLTRGQVETLYGWAVKCIDAACPSDREAGVFFVECRRCGFGRHAARTVDSDDVFQHVTTCTEGVPAYLRVYDQALSRIVSGDQAIEERCEAERFRHDEEAEMRRFGFRER